MKNNAFIITIGLIFSLLLFSSCVTQNGNLVLPPTRYELRVISGSVRISTESIVSNDASSINRFSDLSQNTTTKEVYLSAGSTYPILVEYDHIVHLLIQSVFQDSTIEYTNTLLGIKKKLQISKDNLFGKMVILYY